jgi:hypothetical protein
MPVPRSGGSAVPFRLTQPPGPIVTELIAGGRRAPVASATATAMTAATPRAVTAMG